MAATTFLLVHHDGKVESVKKEEVGALWLARGYSNGDITKYFERAGHAVSKCGDHQFPSTLVYVERPKELYVGHVERMRRHGYNEY